MNRPAAFILLISLLAIASGAGDLSPSTRESPTSSPVVFKAVDVFIDSHDKPLACYQVQILATAGDVELVGVEGGESAAFNAAPFYDPHALQGKRIIIGAYSLGNNLPAGKTRVARLMVQVTGTARPDYQATLQVAASSDAKSIPATVSLEPASTAPTSRSSSSIKVGDAQ